MDISFCPSALERALGQSTPEIFNTDQGSQFTSAEFTNRVEKAGAAVSQDGKSPALDNIFVERLWRSVKYEEVYLQAYTAVAEALQVLRVLQQQKATSVFGVPTARSSAFFH
jgi:putative transposase